MHSPIKVFFFYPLVACFVAPRFGNGSPLWEFDSDVEDDISGMNDIVLSAIDMVNGNYIEPDRSSYPRCTPDEVSLWKHNTEFRDAYTSACNGRSKTARHMVYLRSIARALYQKYRNGTKKCFTCHAEFATCRRHYCLMQSLIDEGSAYCLGCTDLYCTTDFKDCLGVELEEDMPLRPLSIERANSNAHRRPPKRPKRNVREQTVGF